MAADPQHTNEAIDVMSGVTVTHVVLMAILALAALAVIAWGMMQSRRRRAARDRVDENFAIAEEHGATSAASTASLDGTAAVSADGPAPTVPSQSQSQGQTQGPGLAHTPIATDLAQIKGLGPKLAATLAEQGITRVEQIAALTPPDAAALDAKLGTFRGRMARDRWIEQATLLTAGDRAGYEAAFGKLGG